ncbi:MAG: single-stranded DNA-binding protein [Saprospiraceae bacterium]
MKNYVQLIGHLGAAPELRTTATGKQSARFSVATNNSYKNDKGERVESTTWHRIIGWNRTAEAMETKLEKGTKVMIEGALQYRNFEDKEGVTRNYTEIIAQRFLTL